MALVTISPANIAADATFNHINSAAQLQNKGLWPAPLEKQVEQIPVESAGGKGWWRIAMVLHSCDSKKEDVSRFCVALCVGVCVCVRARV